MIQHLLTERIFRTVFSNPDFVHRNIIAREIETVITALMSHAFNRDEFLKSLDPFYVAIERTAATMDDFSQKQGFLNTVYEQFFQGFSVEVADTHGIVYTPQPIVDFMVRSVDQILKTEFENGHGERAALSHRGKSRRSAFPPLVGIKGGCLIRFQIGMSTSSTRLWGPAISSCGPCGRFA